MLRRTDTSYDYHPKKLSPDTIIKGLPSGITVCDFWSWAYSDVLVNTIRSTLAEYLVAYALGETANPRVEWDHVDVLHDGRKIEVKSAAYLQSWPQDEYSDIRFDIGVRKYAWDQVKGEMVKCDSRLADCYVFCLFTSKDDGIPEVLDVAKWVFYVLPTAVVDREFGIRKNTSLKSIQKLTAPVNYDHLRCAIEGAIHNPP